ncbi:integrase core domain-containing protein [Roseobacter sp. EG26]|uniref:integrase core domain-containing protein n=1 Tax=Roseobacter sp. EG26 TaxID=3412477 RepID=UPI003CE53733
MAQFYGSRTGIMRRKFLNAEWIHTTKQAQIVLSTWLRQHNRVRQHQALRPRPHVPETLLKSSA